MIDSAPIGVPSSVRRAISPTELLGPLNDLERKFAPQRLWVEGRLERPLRHPRVAIIGTRRPSIEGRRAAATYAKVLAHRGVTVVSGLAEGIDTAAHESAIAAGGSTIAVLGTPLSRTYPSTNKELQQLIMREHLAVSQFPEGYPVKPGNFVQRNRTMALLSDASIIVESAEDGGSLHQGWEAIRLGRPLLLRNAIFADSKLQWPSEMAKYGAIPLLKPEDVLEVVPRAAPRILVDASD